MPLIGTGPDTIIGLLNMSYEDFKSEMEEALDINFNTWY